MAINTMLKIKQRCERMHDARVWRRVCNFKQRGQCQKALCGGDSGFLPIHRISGLGPKMAPTTQHRNQEPEARYAGSAPRQSPCKLLSWCFPLEFFCCALLWVSPFGTGLSHASHKCHPSLFVTWCHLEHAGRGSSKQLSQCHSARKLPGTTHCAVDCYSFARNHYSLVPQFWEGKK